MELPPEGLQSISGVIGMAGPWAESLKVARAQVGGVESEVMIDKTRLRTLQNIFSFAKINKTQSMITMELVDF